MKNNEQKPTTKLDKVYYQTQTSQLEEDVKLAGFEGKTEPLTHIHDS